MILDKFYMPFMINRAYTVAKMSKVVKGKIIGTIVVGIGAKKIVIAEIHRKEKKTERQENYIKSPLPIMVFDLAEFKQHRK